MVDRGRRLPGVGREVLVDGVSLGGVARSVGDGGVAAVAHCYHQEAV